jgi:hypothetical protein
LADTNGEKGILLTTQTGGGVGEGVGALDQNAVYRQGLALTEQNIALKKELRLCVFGEPK